MRCWRGRGQEAPHGAAIGKGSDQTHNILFQYKDKPGSFRDTALGCFTYRE